MEESYEIEETVSMVSINVKPIKDSDFEEEVLNSNRATLVDFWAEWCGPCKALAPKIEQIASEYESQVKFVKMNVDHNPSTPSKYGVRGIPTLILFKDGKVINQAIGDQSLSDLKSFLDSSL